MIHREFYEYTIKVHADGTKYIFFDNINYKENEPADQNFIKEYTVKVFDDERKFINNKEPYQENGLVIEPINGINFWFLNGKLHRKDGPAIECPGGVGRKFWYLNGKELTEEEFNKKIIDDAFMLSLNHGKFFLL